VCGGRRLACDIIEHLSSLDMRRPRITRGQTFGSVRDLFAQGPSSGTGNEAGAKFYEEYASSHQARSECKVPSHTHSLANCTGVLNGMT
jgi:hypothetical protein